MWGTEKEMTAKRCTYFHSTKQCITAGHRKSFLPGPPSNKPFKLLPCCTGHTHPSLGPTLAFAPALHPPPFSTWQSPIHLSELSMNIHCSLRSLDPGSCRMSLSLSRLVHTSTRVFISWCSNDLVMPIYLIRL